MTRAMLRRTGRRPAIIPIAVLALSLISLTAQAEEKPLWEVGMGVGGIVFPDYRGSDELQTYPVPVPYVIYRGKFLKADRDGVRGELFNRGVAELSLSVSGSVPVNSDDSDARRGMPDLKPTLELGPAFDLHLWRSPDRNVKFDLVLPLRVPVTIESSPHLIGWMFAPRLNLDVEDVAGFEGWNVGVGAGPLLANGRYHEYFYSVAPRYATPERPAYGADGGYSGVHFLASISKRFPSYWIGAYVRFDDLHGAAFRDSPLIKQEHAISGGLGFAWMIGKSERTVEVEE